MSAVGIGDLIPFWHKKCSVSFFDEETLTLCARYFFLSKKLWASAISKYLQFSIYIYIKRKRRGNKISYKQ